MHFQNIVYGLCGYPIPPLPHLHELQSVLGSWPKDYISKLTSPLLSTATVFTVGRVIPGGD